MGLLEKYNYQYRGLRAGTDECGIISEVMKVKPPRPTRNRKTALVEAGHLVRMGEYRTAFRIATTR